ncbi:hypothetical protein DFH28DRAFT_886164 [Melampsora americana]|nr:hypothetical protein DFH28DRAFT_886164 [Melampsora americana]
MDPKYINQLMEMGATRSAAISALRASKGDVNEAANVVFDPKHVDATLSDSDSQLLIEKSTQSTSKLSNVTDDNAQDDELTSVEAESDDGEIHEDIDFFEGEVEQVGADPFAQISFQKDRKEIMLEIEETPEKVEIDINQISRPAIIMPQSQWMKGCAEGNEQSFLFQIYSRLTDTKCACVAEKCDGVIQRQRTNFFAIPDTFALYIQHLEQVVQAKCPDCGRVICLACSDEVAVPSSSKEPALAGHPSDALLHCPDLQAVILGVGLSLVEKMYYGTLQPESLPSPEIRPSKKTKLYTPPINPNDLSESDSFEMPHYGHARGARSGPKGVGYDGAPGGDDQSGQEAASQIQKMQDQSLASLLASIRVFMPNRSRKGPFRSSDHMPSIATAIHIRRRFNPIASDLLKNDSLSDMSERRVLYEEFLEWLLIVSAHENLGSIMGQPIMRATSSRYLPATTDYTGEGLREKEITYEGSAGPRELLENLSRQVKAARHAMRSSESESQAQVKKSSSLYRLTRGRDEEEVEKLNAFCERFEKAVTAIDSSLESNNNHRVIEAIKSLNCIHVPVSNDLSSVSLDILQARYVKWATSVKYEYYDFEVPSPPDDAPIDGVTRATETIRSLGSNAPRYLHAYAREIQNTYSYPARNTAIAREHSTLIGALPIAWDSSVFLRVDESRQVSSSYEIPDVIKALITGPEGTPYSNGCFIFDIFLNSNYNQSPPVVKSMTTKGGKYRLNPNLYADGKVCLSLLGTWDGPGWIGGKSTLLQVIISIQSMILCQEPYLNEPGWATMSGTPASNAYNLNVRRMVVDDAMIESIKNPNPAFKNVIKTHFRLKSQAIKDQLDQWLVDDDGQALRTDNPGGAVGAARVGIGQDSMLARNVEEMKRLLDQLAIETETDD